MGIKNLFGKPNLPNGILHSSFSCMRDELEIGGNEYRPKGENLPAAIVCHGFMANQETVKHYAVWLAQLGYAAYTFDFNGGSVMKSCSKGKTTEMSVLTEVQDLEAVIAHVRTLPYVNSEDILLMGCSQGGFVAALAAARRKYPVTRLSLFYPALCIPDDARAGKMMMAKFDPKHVPETLWCGPMKLGKCYVEDVLDMDPFDAISGYPGEVLIVHGTHDSIVKLDYSRKAEKIYQRSAKSVRLCIIEGGGHMFSEAHDRIAMDALKAFADQSQRH